MIERRVKKKKGKEEELSLVREEKGTRERASEKGLRKGRTAATRNSVEESGDEELPP